MVLGARVPIVLTSRADSVRSRMASCAAAVLYADARRRISELCQQRDCHGCDTGRQRGLVERQIPGLWRRRSRDLVRLVKGQADGIGTRPRLRAEATDKKLLIDQDYAREKIAGCAGSDRESRNGCAKLTISNLSRSVIALSMAGRTTIGQFWSTPKCSHDSTVCSARAVASTEQSCADPSPAGALSAAAAGRLFRYGLPPRP